MDQAVYAVESAVEENHWWFVGRRKLFAEALSHLNLSPSARVLDVGTSTGTNLRLLRELGFSHVTGVDASPAAVAACEQKGLGTVLLGDVCQLPLPDGSVDLVLATDILEHVDDDAVALREIARVLAPGGRVLLTVPAFPSLWGLQDEVSHHKRRYRIEALTDRVRDAGLTIDTSYYFNFLLFPSIWLARQVIRGLGIQLQSENEVNTPLLNRVLSAVFAIDTKLAPKLAVPFGVSALVCAHKPLPASEPVNPPDDRTIRDFGEQWTHYTKNDGYYGSVELLKDIFGPLLSTDQLASAKVAEIGSGTGRIVAMLLDAGAKSAVAVEPSDAIGPLRENLARYGDRVTCLHLPGHQLPQDLALDYVFSIGVIHHIPEPLPVLRAAYAALRPGGQCLVWLYGYEGNERYLQMVTPLRQVTTRLPHAALSAVSHALNLGLDGYLYLCRFADLPLRSYIQNVLSKFDRDKRYLVIYDQLNPVCSRYYRKEEAQQLMESAGFVDVRLHHRHGYSWTVVGTRPATVA